MKVPTRKSLATPSMSRRGSSAVMSMFSNVHREAVDVLTE
jgi:hypothetical protein